MKLFIAEKPSLAQAIAAGIGVGKKCDGYISLNSGKEIVTWCYGHILAQLNPDEYAEKYRAWRMEDLPIIPSLWKLKVKPEAAKQFRIVRELISKATTIVNAADPDREGQLLVDEVLDYVGNKKPVQRILMNALDEKSVKQSLNDLRDNYEFEGMKNAALGRSRADWLIGMNLSRAYTIRARQVGYEGVSVGRVMTPTMALVVRREEEIAKFKPVTHYAVKAIFANNLGEIPTMWQMSDKVASVDSEGRLLDKKVAEDFLARLNAPVGRQGKIIRVEEKKKTENQRLPYSLSTLQIEAGKRYGYSPQTVLDTMQMLYEKKLTTYPRSDCEYLPENQFADSKEILEHLKDLPNFSELVRNADTSIHSKAWNDKKISAHHAIIPTRIKANFEKLNAIEQNLYVMVSQAYLAQFYPVHEYKATTVVISFADEKFIGKGKLVKIIINLEPQKTTRKIHYKLMKRAVYYAARLISSQKEKEFHGDDYNGLKKVYSIWIAMNVQNYRADSIQTYQLTEQLIHGKFRGDNPKNYDLISIVILNLGKKPTSHKLLNLLYLIFMDLKSSAEKETILHDEYHIDITRDMREELKKMGGLMEPAIEVAVERNSERVTAETKKQTLLESVRNLMETLNLTAKQAMDALKIPANKQKEYIALI